MSREIEVDFTYEWGNEETQCHKCVSFFVQDGKSYCKEGQCEVPPTAHCNFFQSIS